MLFRSLILGAREVWDAEACQDKANLEVSGHSKKRAELFKSLLHVYQEAKDAYLKLPPKSVDTTHAARFLRDTTENFISYIQSVETQPDCAEYRQRLPELRETLERTNDFVERCCGGKKRVWEQQSVQQQPVKRTVQNLDVKRGVESKMDSGARQFLRENSYLTQSSRRELDDPSNGPLSRQQQPQTLGSSARRRRGRNRPANSGHAQPEINRQSAAVRSHQGKGKRSVLHDVYRPRSLER